MPYKHGIQIHALDALLLMVQILLMLRKVLRNKLPDSDHASASFLSHTLAVLPAKVVLAKIIKKRKVESGDNAMQTVPILFLLQNTTD